MGLTSEDKNYGEQSYRMRQLSTRLTAGSYKGGFFCGERVWSRLKAQFAIANEA